MVTSLYAGKGKLRVSSEPSGAYVYVDGKKKAMTGEGFTSILLEEGEHVVRVVKLESQEYQKYAQKNIFIGTDSSMKIMFKLEKMEPTSSYREILAKKHILKLHRWKRIGKTVIDTQLNLIWQDNMSTKIIKRNWKNAKKYCSNLSLEGYNDWKLPTVNQLDSIRDIDNASNVVSIPAFKNMTSNNCYWSSTEDDFDGYAKIMCLQYSYRTNYKISDKFDVRCVRYK